MVITLSLTVSRKLGAMYGEERQNPFPIEQETCSVRPLDVKNSHRALPWESQSFQVVLVVRFVYLFIQPLFQCSAVFNWGDLWRDLVSRILCLVLVHVYV